MAEFCYECLKEVFDVNLEAKKYVFSKELELCEGCGEYKNVVICEQNRYYYLRKIRFLIILLCIAFLPVTIISMVIYSFFWHCKLNYRERKNKKLIDTKEKDK